MTEKERLIYLMNTQFNELIKDGNWSLSDMISNVADCLLKNGVIVLPCEKVYYIVDKNTKYATVFSKNIKELSIDAIRDFPQYGYYKTKEEAEKVLKGE